jgi:shikimate dehydrogenase
MKQLAVLGHPVAHSRSPAMQNAALESLGLAGEWAYEAIDVEPGEFERRVRGLPEAGFVGANATIPHKEAALAVADESSDAALEIGAANTLIFSDGVIRADNTDAKGLLAALPDGAAAGTALVLGAGGSARAAAWALARHGASVSVWNRTAERAAELARDLAVEAVTGDDARATSHDLIVNCTAIGMGDEDPFQHLPIDRERLRAGVVVVDLVYAGRESGLLAAGRERGATAIDGLEILVRQGAESLRIWTGMDPPLEVMLKAAQHP